ncbi:MAG: HlyD family efflux transporter periplasmic adaptor subunit [Planctomycetota bacterium]
MIDLKKLSTPAWQRVIAELTAEVPTDQAFLARLTSVLAQVSSARQGVLFALPPAGGEETSRDPKPVFIWPAAGGAEQPAGENGVMYEADARQAIRRVAGHSGALVFQVSTEGPYYESGGAQILAVPVPTSGPGGVAPEYVVSLLLEPRSESALQTTVALAEVIAGYTHGRRAMQALRDVRGASAALDLAAQLISTINTASNFKGACLQLVNDVQRQTGVDRVALGWCKGIGPRGEGEKVKCVAISDTEMLDRRMKMVRSMEAAMDECLDQEQPVLYPAPPEAEAAESLEEADVLLSQAITHAHRELAASDANLRIASLPLRVEDRVVGVLTLETSAPKASNQPPKVDIKGNGAPAAGGAGLEDPLSIEQLETVQAACDLIAPVMRIRRSDDRMLPLRALDSSVATAGWVVGPKHTVWKLGALVVMALLLATIFVRIPYRVEAPCQVQPRERRTVSVPFSAVIASVPEDIEPGARVEVGQLLAQLETTDLRLQRLDVQNEILRAERRADEARARGELSEAQQAEAQADQARARLALIDLRVEQASITAPIAGIIISGNASDFEGASVELGQPLFEVAAMDDLLIQARADDRDIKLILEAQAAGLRGSMATKAYPSRRFDVDIERIVPLATPDQGKNTFEVRAALDASADWMRPGMEGLVKFDTGERTLIDIGTRRIRDQLRLWLWF